MIDLRLNPIQEDDEHIWFGWSDPPSGTEALVYYVDGQRVSRTCDRKTRTAKFAKGASSYAVTAMPFGDPLARGVWPPDDPAVVITSAAALKTALLHADADDNYRVVGTFAGQYDARCPGGRFDFAEATFPGGSGYCSIQAVSCGARLENLNVTKGGSSGGIIVNGGCDGLVLTGRIRDCYGTGLLVQGNEQVSENKHVDVDMEIRNCGLDWANDPHTLAGGQPGTGWHACYWGGAKFPSRGRAKLRVFDQGSGAGIQIGANAQDLTVDIEGERITRNVDLPPFAKNGGKQVAGNLIQFWGGGNRRTKVERAIGVDLAGRVVEADALDAPSSGIVVQYARGTNVRLRPAYAQPKPGVAPITYEDVSVS